MKQCGDCKLHFENGEFNKRGDGLQPWCRECNRKRSRQYYAENKEKHKQVVRDRNIKTIEENRSKFQEIKAKCSCTVDGCNEKVPICLDFHHLGDKDDGICRGINNGWSWDRIVKEMKKCIVMCSNCHRKLHAGLITIDESKRWKE